MSATRTNHSTPTARKDSGSVLTAIRGKVRRLPEGVAKQQAELLAAQIANGVPEKFIAGQMKVMGGGK